MILTMLSNLFWASHLMINILKDFCLVAFGREKNRLHPLDAIPTGRPTLLEMWQ